jgi:tetratricopeptide (TPR) repeat protein
MSDLDEIEDLLKKGEKEKAFELIKDKDTNSLAEGLIERGSSLIENEGYDLAITYFKFSEKIAIDKDIKETARIHLTDVYYNRGNAYGEKGDFDRAIEDFDKALELNPEYADAYFNRGTAHSALNQHEKAIENYNKAIELDPNFAGAYNNRGLIYYNLMMHNEAIADYNKAIELDQNFDIAHANLGNLLYMTEDYDNAEKEYREALKINEDIDYAHNGLGLVLSKRKAYKNAIAEFKKALKLNKDADFYNNLGCAYAECGKGSVIAPFRFFNARSKLRKTTQEKNTYIEAHKNITHVGDLLNYELKIFLLRIFIILFVFSLSINLFEPITINRWILILTGVATLGIVLFSLDFTKIEIKSLKIAGVVEAEFKYEKPKAGEKAVQFAEPK